MSTFISSTVKGLHLNLDRAGTWIAPLTLRMFLAWKFFESGLEKFNGENWFADIQDRFLFPFNHLPATLNWELSMWVELICALALLVGLGHTLFGHQPDGGHHRRHRRCSLAGRLVDLE